MSFNNFNQALGNAAVPQRNPYSSNYFNPNLPTNNIIWVQGLEGAKAYQLSPKSMAILLDNEIDGRFYIKVTDDIGMVSSFRMFDFQEVLTTPNATNNNDLDLSQFVKKDELGNLMKEIMNEQLISTADGGSADDSTKQPKIIFPKK